MLIEIVCGVWSNSLFGWFYVCDVGIFIEDEVVGDWNRDIERIVSINGVKNCS